MNQLEMAKDAMACENCNGEGCEACQGNMGQRHGRPGEEHERQAGTGHGHKASAMVRGRREERHEPSRYASATEAGQRRGNVSAAWSKGPNIKGDVAESIKEEMATLSAEPADPLTSERLAAQPPGTGGGVFSECSATASEMRQRGQCHFGLLK